MAQQGGEEKEAEKSGEAVGGKGKNRTVYEITV